MHRTVLAFLILMSVMMTGCGKSGVVNTYEESEKDGIMVTYYEMEDGTWKCREEFYDYRLELTGRMPNAERDGYYAVLTDNPDLTYDEVAKSLYSSLLIDSMVMDGSVIVEMK